uniref:Uncharacterized protein n=1 Tax=Oryza rufipogon TaxID=4529 RepID=A0A0E0R372_ORYRU
KPAASAETPANGRRRSLRQSAVGAGRSCSGGPRAGGGLKRRRAISGKPSSPPSYPFFRRRFRCDWFLVSPLPATPHGSGFRSLFSIHYRIHFLKANFWFLTKGT